MRMTDVLIRFGCALRQSFAPSVVEELLNRAQQAERDRDRALEQIEEIEHQRDSLEAKLDELTSARGTRSRALQLVNQERTRQDSKWGEQNHPPVFWTGILGEEFGELCQAVNETVFDNGPEERKKGGVDNMMREACQVAAVAVSFMECLMRASQREQDEGCRGCDWAWLNKDRMHVIGCSKGRSAEERLTCERREIIHCADAKAVPGSLG